MMNPVDRLQLHHNLIYARHAYERSLSGDPEIEAQGQWNLLRAGFGLRVLFVSQQAQSPIPMLDDDAIKAVLIVIDWLGECKDSSFLNLAIELRDALRNLVSPKDCRLIEDCLERHRKSFDILEAKGILSQMFEEAAALFRDKTDAAKPARWRKQIELAKIAYKITAVLQGDEDEGLQTVDVATLNIRQQNLYEIDQPDFIRGVLEFINLLNMSINNPIFANFGISTAVLVAPQAQDQIEKKLLKTYLRNFITAHAHHSADFALVAWRAITATNYFEDLKASTVEGIEIAMSNSQHSPLTDCHLSLFALGIAEESSVLYERARKTVLEKALLVPDHGAGPILEKASELDPDAALLAQIFQRQVRIARLGEGVDWAQTLVMMRAPPPEYSRPAVQRQVLEEIFGLRPTNNLLFRP